MGLGFEVGSKGVVDPGVTSALTSTSSKSLCCRMICFRVWG